MSATSTPSKRGRRASPRRLSPLKDASNSPHRNRSLQASLQEGRNSPSKTKTSSPTKSTASGTNHAVKSIKESRKFKEINGISNVLKKRSDDGDSVKPRKGGRSKKTLERVGSDVDEAVDKLDVVTPEPSPKKVQRVSRPKRLVEQDDSDQSDDAATKPSPKKNRRVGRPKKVIEQDDSDQSDDAAPEPSPKKVRIVGRPKKVIEQDDEDDEQSDDAAPEPSPKKVQKGGRPKKVIEREDSDEDDDDHIILPDEESDSAMSDPSPKKARRRPGPKRMTRKPSRRDTDDDDDPVKDVPSKGRDGSCLVVEGEGYSIELSTEDDEQRVDPERKKKKSQPKVRKSKPLFHDSDESGEDSRPEIYKKIENCKILIPLLDDSDELTKLLETLGWESDLKIPGHLIKKQKSRSDNENPAGEYEVEEIVDSGMDDDGNVKYLVHWKRWDDPKDYTWEPASNLANSRPLVLAYHKKLSEMDENEAHENLIHLILVLTKVTAMDRAVDEGLLLKLCQKDLSYTVNKNWVKELKQSLAKKCSLALDFLIRGAGELGSPSALLDTTVRELRINDTFGSLKQMFQWIEGRFEQEEGNRERMEEINDSIQKLNDGPATVIENYVDNAIVPKFEYTKDYVPFNIAYDNTPVLRCSCTDCHETKKPTKKQKQEHQEAFCCWHECAKKPYSKTGVLILDEREPIYECNPTCACGDSCPFKVVSKGRMYQVGIFRTPNDRGWGLKAMERIPKGKFVITYTGELIDADENDKRAVDQNRDEETYLMDLDYNPDASDVLFAIDAKKVSNVARFLNHSCEPNLVVHPCWIHNMDLNLPIIAFFSNQVIEKGKELTFDYNARKTEEHQEKKKKKNEENPDADDEEDEPPPVFGCRCGAETCKGFYF